MGPGPQIPIFYINCFFILSAANPQIMNSIAKIRLSLNKPNPKIYRIGVVKDKLYVTKIIKEMIPKIEQNFRPFFIIIFANLSKLLKLFIIFLIIFITYTNNNTKKI